ncbi:MAG: hypothetical protein HY005_00950 [Candidatus Staskawiczbacteria bacterium]|nr:hypothetical protein [Candidatus Staskawiczbacteria bacterium]MBI3337176.1 hypothetical protein [Candidatus Staskawiczbacteria bacterium]
MNFGIFSKLRDNKLWWIDVVFYFIISFLIATISCYFIFAVKIYFQKENIKAYNVSLDTVGTEEQREMEKQVLDYQKKLNDYYPLIKNHRIFSNILTYFEQNTLPKVWFSKFSMNSKDVNIILSGETDSMEIFSRQVSVFEESEYFTKITVLGSTLGDKNKNSFNIVLSLDPKIFAFMQKPIIKTENQ